MSQVTFTDADRDAFAGLLPFAPGASAPFTPPAFESVDAGRRPIFYLRPYTQADREAMQKAGWTKESIASAMENGAVSRWENLPSLPDGAEVPYGPGILIGVPDVVFYQIHKRIGELTSGPTKEEKRALT